MVFIDNVVCNLTKTLQMKEKNLYFPCILMEHNNSEFSIILSDFQYFDDYFGDKGGGGYSIDKLAKKLAKDDNIKKEIRFDSEAGMFCAYSKDKKKLLLLCNLLKEITGEEEEYLPEEVTKPLIPIDEAEKLLLNGFVISLQKDAQETFLKNVPMPSLNKTQAEYIKSIKNGTDEEKIYAAKRINSEARSNTRNWNNYLSHPNTISIILDAIDKEENSKVYQELIWALVFICGRHLPDLRTKKYFLEALKHKSATLRWLGVIGLERIYNYPFEFIYPLVNDKSSKVRKAIAEIGRVDYVFPIWMFDPMQKKIDNYPKDILPLLYDKDEIVQWYFIRKMGVLKIEQVLPELKDKLKVEKNQKTRNELDDAIKAIKIRHDKV